MTIAEIKTKMLAHRDFYGGDIMQTDEINKAKTKKDLAKVLDSYESHLEMIALDAISHHSRFRKSLGLHMV